MALVIFCVALVEAMRTRISFSEAILSSPWRPVFQPGRVPLVRQARPCAGHPRLIFSATSKDVDGRDKPGHDGMYQAKVLEKPSTTVFSLPAVSSLRSRV